MYFYLKKISIVLLALLIPLGASAALKDFLVVSGQFVSGAFTNVAVDEYLINSDEVKIYTSGSYEIRLYDNERAISSNFFEIPEITEMETIGANNKSGGKIYGSSLPTKQSIQSIIPIGQSISLENAKLQIIKDGNILFDKKLSELSFDIVSAGENRITTSQPSSSVSAENIPPDENQPQKSGRSFGLFIVIAILIGGAMFLADKTGILKKIQNKLSKPKNEQ